MFTGLVEARVPVSDWERRGVGGRLRIPPPELPPDAPPWDPRQGESIAVAGVCLSVAALEPGGGVAFDLSAETLERTWFAELAPGRLLNLERSLRLGDRLGGHLVSGHVDGLGRLVELEDAGDGGRVATFEVEPGFERWLVEKGSVCVEGVSLTVVRPEGRRFRVALIPETLSRTNLGPAVPGQRMHLEADMVGKWIEKLFPG